METIITLPAALMVIRALNIRESEEPGQAWQSAILSTIALWVVALVYLLAVYSLLTQQRADFALTAYGGYAGILATMPGVFLTYLRMIVWPSGLSADYVRPILQLGDFRAWAPLALWLIVGIWAAVGLLRRDRRVLAPALFFIAIAPFSQLVPFWIMMADRYLYLPMIPLVGGLMYIAQRVTFSLFNYQIRSGLRIALAAIVLLAFGALTFHRAGLWGDSLRLWRDSLNKQPASPVAHFNYANALSYTNRPKEAANQYFITVGNGYPSLDEVRNLTSVLFSLGEQNKAEALMYAGIARWPDSDRLIAQMSLMLINSGRLGEAGVLLSPYLDNTEFSTEILEVLTLWAMRNNDTEAFWRFSQMLHSRDPGNSMYNQVVGFLNQRSGNRAAAAQHYYIAYKHATNPTERSQSCNRLMNISRQRGTVAFCDY